ncbi:MAG: (2Fe-2S)-binding protein [Firmicutes bacterium]|nr:(2Fe-2S)-binding protein [Bacillota bacterium]
MEKELIKFMLNGEPVEVYNDPASSLLHLLREKFSLTGTKEGCGEGECGACTVLLDDLAVNSCLIPAGKVNGRSVETIEALSKDGGVDPIQEAFVEKGAVQCGFCTPGMVMSARALLKQNPDPDPEEIKMAISGNLCRCTGYKQIEAAILLAAGKINSK